MKEPGKGESNWRCKWLFLVIPLMTSLDWRLEVIELALSQQKMQVDCKTVWDYVSLH